MGELNLVSSRPGSAASSTSDIVHFDRASLTPSELRPRRAASEPPRGFTSVSIHPVPQEIREEGGPEDEDVFGEGAVGGQRSASTPPPSHSFRVRRSLSDLRKDFEKAKKEDRKRKDQHVVKID